MKGLRKTLFALLSAYSLFALCIHNAFAANSATATVNFSATVVADCFIQVSPTTIDFENINASEIGTAMPGAQIGSYQKNFTIQPNCYGTDSFTIAFKSDTFDGTSNDKQCASDTGKVLRFCLQGGSGNNPLWMSNGQGSFSSNDGNMPIDMTVSLAKGSGALSTGVKNASINLTISPN